MTDAEQFHYPRTLSERAGSRGDTDLAPGTTRLESDPVVAGALWTVGVAQRGRADQGHGLSDAPAPVAETQVDRITRESESFSERFS